MVGRILTQLKARGVLKEPVPQGSLTDAEEDLSPQTKAPSPLCHTQEPGDLVEVDTLDVRPLPGMVLKQFTARDVVSRWDVVEVHTKATSTTAVGFLDTLTKRMPFPIEALQVDGGSEFQAVFSHGIL